MICYLLKLFLTQFTTFFLKHNGGEGYAVVEGRPVRERRLPCCGIGIGWLL